jgi:hypothetical protein
MLFMMETEKTLFGKRLSTKAFTLKWVCGFGKVILHVKRGFCYCCICINMTEGIQDFICEPSKHERGIRLKTH